MIAALWVRAAGSIPIDAVGGPALSSNLARTARRPVSRFASLLVLTNAARSTRARASADCPGRSHAARRPAGLVRPRAARPRFSTRHPACAAGCRWCSACATSSRCSTTPPGRAASWDEAAARDLARIFVPTRAYRRTLETLERHRFAVADRARPRWARRRSRARSGSRSRPRAGRCTSASGPSRSGRRSTPTARSSSSPTTPSARPSTGPTPPTAGRSTSTASCRRLDERHWLVWTSRPAPLKAGLGRIHREHGVERFPQPAEVHVDASDPRRRGEGADPLPARARGQSSARTRSRSSARTARRSSSTRTSRRAGSAASSQLRLPQLALDTPGRRLSGRDRGRDRRADDGDGGLAAGALAGAPRAARRADRPAARPGRRARAVRHRAPARARGPARARRSTCSTASPTTSCASIPPATVTWVHPSWRDLVIDELAADPAARRSFLRHCSLDGLLLALSHAGGLDGHALAAAARRRRRLGRGRRADPRARAGARRRRRSCACSRASRRRSTEPTHRAAAELRAPRDDGARAPGGRAGAAPRRQPDPEVLGKWLDLAARLPEPPASLDVRAHLGARRPARRHAAHRARGRAVPPLAAARGDADASARPTSSRSSASPTPTCAQLHALLVVALHARRDRRASGTMRATLLEALSLVSTLVPSLSGSRDLRRPAAAPGSSRPAEPAPEPDVRRRRRAAPDAPSIVRRILADLG